MTVAVSKPGSASVLQWTPKKSRVNFGLRRAAGNATSRELFPEDELRNASPQSARRRSTGRTRRRQARRILHARLSARRAIQTGPHSTPFRVLSTGIRRRPTRFHCRSTASLARSIATLARSLATRRGSTASRALSTENRFRSIAIKSQSKPFRLASIRHRAFRNRVRGVFN